MAKLGWWREELQRAAEGGPRHPLTQSLFADAGVRAVPLSCWTAVVDAALLLVAAPPSADFAAQRRAIAPLAAATAALETRVWFGPSVGVARAAAVTALASLFADLRALAIEVARGRSPLPMNLLARHGLTIEGLTRQNQARGAALRDYAQLLRDALAEAATIPGPLTLFRAVELRHDLQDLERAASAEDPLAALRPRRPGFGDLLKTWRAARTWRGMPRNEANASSAIPMTYACRMWPRAASRWRVVCWTGSECRASICPCDRPTGRAAPSPFRHGFRYR
jgi:phytoene synthase